MGGPGFTADYRMRLYAIAGRASQPHNRDILRMPERPTFQSLSRFPAAARRDIRVVFTDIDDTLTTDGRLTARAYDALEALQAAGILVVPITGRPAGWCDHIARMWPVDAVVGENGAFYFRYDRLARRMTRRFDQPEALRAGEPPPSHGPEGQHPRGRPGLRRG